MLGSSRKLLHDEVGEAWVPGLECAVPGMSCQRLGCMADARTT